MSLTTGVHSARSSWPRVLAAVPQTSQKDGHERGRVQSAPGEPRPGWKRFEAAAGSPARSPSAGWRQTLRSMGGRHRLLFRPRVDEPLESNSTPSTKSSTDFQTTLTFSTRTKTNKTKNEKTKIMTQQNNYRFISLRLGANKRTRDDSAQPFVIYIITQLKNKQKKYSFSLIFS